MRRAWIVASAVAVTIALAAVLALGIVLANRDRIGLAGLDLGGLLSGVADHGTPRQGEDADWGPTAIFDVLEDGTLSPAATGTAAEVWDAFTRVATQDFAAEVILTYTTGDRRSADLLAYVQQDAERPQYWHFAANLAGATDVSYLLTTLIHEYAHILTLDLSQMPTSTDCDVVAHSQGCWYEDAYISAFWDAFWSGYGDDAPPVTNSDSSVTEAFYLAHEEDFVSSYAAKNVEEDIAESFMAYVIEPVPDPAQGTVAAKLAFFERYPELSAIRERIRAEFGDELQPVWDP